MRLRDIPEPDNVTTVFRALMHWDKNNEEIPDSFLGIDETDESDIEPDFKTNDHPYNDRGPGLYACVYPHMYIKADHMTRREIEQMTYENRNHVPAYHEIDLIYVKWLVSRQEYTNGNDPEQLFMIPNIRKRVCLSRFYDRRYRELFGNQFEVAKAIYLIRAIRKRLDNSLSIDPRDRFTSRMVMTSGDMRNPTYDVPYPTFEQVDEIVVNREFPIIQTVSGIEERIMLPRYNRDEAFRIGRELSRLVVGNTDVTTDICPKGYVRLMPYIHQKAEREPIMGARIPNYRNTAPEEIRNGITYPALIDLYARAQRRRLDDFNVPDVTGPIYVHPVIMQSYCESNEQVTFTRERLFWIATNYYRIYQPRLLNEIQPRAYYGLNTEEDTVDYNHMFKIGFLPCKW